MSAYIYGGYAWGFFASIASFAFFVLVIWLVVTLVRGTRNNGASGTSRAVHILQERYARGEISREEFLERRAVLAGRK